MKLYGMNKPYTIITHLGCTILPIVVYIGLYYDYNCLFNYVLIIISKRIKKIYNDAGIH